MTKTNLSIHTETYEVSCEILNQLYFYLKGRGNLNRKTISGFEQLMKLIVNKKYPEALQTLEALKLYKTDLRELYYIPSRWLCALRVINRSLISTETVWGSLKNDIQAETAETLGMWSYGYLIHPHPNNVDSWPNRNNKVIRDLHAPLGYRMLK